MKEEKEFELDKKKENVGKKKKTSSIVYVILVAVIVFAIVFGGITLVEKFSTSSSERNNDTTINEEKEEEEEDAPVSNDQTAEGVGDVSTEPPVPFNFTEKVKNELNSIADITADGKCGAFKEFYNQNTNINKLSVEAKRNIVLDYYFTSEKKYDSINEASYKNVASKYGFTESFDVMFSGMEKKDGSYIIPPVGCVGPEKVSHDITYTDAGSLVLTDNVTITNTENSNVEKMKMIYTFSYEKSGDDYKFVLVSVNSEQK